jgi:hypothetical protein
MRMQSGWALVAVLTMVAAAALPGVGLAVATVSGSASHLNVSPAVVPANYTSSNWAGYFAQGKSGHTNDSVTMVSGTWVQPKLNCTSPTTAVTVIWVGIDGAFSTTVEQTGSFGQCVSGHASYFLWWELYPLNNIQTISGVTVHAGDKINANVTYSATTKKFTMSVADGTHSFSHTGTQSGTLRNSAECIVERPSGSSGLYPLAKFTTATFSTCTANINGVSHGIGGFPAVGKINMMGTKKVIASTSALTASTKFTVTWKGYD